MYIFSMKFVEICVHMNGYDVSDIFFWVNLEIQNCQLKFDTFWSWSLLIKKKKKKCLIEKGDKWKGENEAPLYISIHHIMRGLRKRLVHWLNK